MKIDTVVRLYAGALLGIAGVILLSCAGLVFVMWWGIIKFLFAGVK